MPSQLTHPFLMYDLHGLQVMELCEALNATLDTVTSSSRAANTSASEQPNMTHSRAAALAATAAPPPTTVETDAAGDADLRFLRSRVLRLRLALTARMAPDQLPDLAAEVRIALTYGLMAVSHCLGHESFQVLCGPPIHLYCEEHTQPPPLVDQPL